MPTRPSDFNHDDYHHDWRSSHHYHIGRFREEPGWLYDEPAIDNLVSQVFRGEDQYITDYWLFGLAVPPVGYEWVRYGPDALLIDIKDGKILQAVRGVFA